MLTRKEITTEQVKRTKKHRQEPHGVEVAWLFCPLPHPGSHILDLLSERGRRTTPGSETPIKHARSQAHKTHPHKSVTSRIYFFVPLLPAGGAVNLPRRRKGAACR